jgi:biotin transport system permease protein
MIGLDEGDDRAGTSLLHRLPAGVKLAGLMVIALALFLVDDPRLLAGAAVVALGVARSTGRPFGRLARDLTGALVVIAAVGLIDWVFITPATALTVVPRLVALALFAHAVTLTTTTSELAETLETAFRPLQRIGLLDAARASLTLTLAIRFVPLIVEEAREIREAQAARGLSASPLALAVPLVVRVLVRAEEVAEAIDARGFPPSPPLPHRPIDQDTGAFAP